MSLTESMERFHAHLDECRQCREHPFALCKVGEPLLRATADEDAVEGLKKVLDGDGGPSA